MVGSQSRHYGAETCGTACLDAREVNLPLQLALELNQPFQCFREVFEGGCRQHDCVASSAHVFRDLEESAALILFKIEKKNLALVHDLFGRDRRGLHPLPRIVVHYVVDGLFGESGCRDGDEIPRKSGGFQCQTTDCRINIPKTVAAQSCFGRHFGEILASIPSAPIAMQSPLTISIYVFVVVFLFLAGICVLLRLLGRIFGGNRSRHPSLSPSESRPPPLNGLAEPPPRRLPNFVPPPTPMTDQEYWEAEQYHFEHGLPAPLPPPRQERDEW
jgi:hypothetical protein